MFCWKSGKRRINSYGQPNGRMPDCTWIGRELQTTNEPCNRCKGQMVSSYGSGRTDRSRRDLSCGTRLRSFRRTRDGLEILINAGMLRATFADQIFSSSPSVQSTESLLLKRGWLSGAANLLEDCRQRSWALDRHGQGQCRVNFKLRSQDLHTRWSLHSDSYLIVPHSHNR